MTMVTAAIILAVIGVAAIVWARDGSTQRRLIVFGVLSVAGIVYVANGRPQMVLDTARSQASFETFSPELTATKRVLERLQETQSKDVQQWIDVASALRLQKAYKDAALALAAAADVSMSDAEKASFFGAAGETLVQGDAGEIGARAIQHFQEALLYDPMSVGAHYFLGKVEEERGNASQAVGHYEAFIVSAGPEHPLFSDIKGRLARLTVDDDAYDSAGTALAPAIRQADIDRVAALSAEDQQAFILSMVSRLEERLQENSDDFSGWRRLARVYVQMGDTDGAIKAYDRALELNSADEALHMERDRLANAVEP